MIPQNVCNKGVLTEANIYNYNWNNLTFLITSKTVAFYDAGGKLGS